MGISVRFRRLFQRSGDSDQPHYCVFYDFPNRNPIVPEKAIAQDPVRVYLHVCRFGTVLDGRKRRVYACRQTNRRRTCINVERGTADSRRHAHRLFRRCGRACRARFK